MEDGGGMEITEPQTSDVCRSQGDPGAGCHRNPLKEVRDSTSRKRSAVLSDLEIKEAQGCKIEALGLALRQQITSLNRVYGREALSLLYTGLRHLRK